MNWSGSKCSHIVYIQSWTNNNRSVWSWLISWFSVQYQCGFKFIPGCQDGVHINLRINPCGLSSPGYLNASCTGLSISHYVSSQQYQHSALNVSQNHSLVCLYNDFLPLWHFASVVAFTLTLIHLVHERLQIFRLTFEHVTGTCVMWKHLLIPRG